MQKIISFAFIALLFFGCQKPYDPGIPPDLTLPALETTAPTNITDTSANSGGNITSDGGSAVTARGICWGIAHNPDISGNHTNEGTGTGVFTSQLTALDSTKTYYLRAYATNSKGTAYGNEITFKYNSAGAVILIPTVITTAVSSVTDSSAQSGGNITSDGGAAITSRGICWSTSPSPSVTGQHSTDGTGTGDFISNIKALTPSTLYYIRAYAINSQGTAYGNEISFTTSTQTPTGYYMAGTRYVNGSEAVLWTNGIATSLTNGSYAMAAKSVYVAGNDVYVAGTGSINSTPRIATVWKNGVATSLTSGSTFAEANTVYADGTNVYVGGLESGLPTVWVNGTPGTLETKSGTTLLENVNSIFVSGGNVYVAGSENNDTRLWLNGAATDLTTSNFDSHAYSVFVSGNDVYVAGNESNGTKNVAKLWKNGVAASLSDGTANASALSVFVVGNDTYVAGYDGDAATVWKNGVATSLERSSVDAKAWSVRVAGTDVYISGDVYSGGSIKARLWKNGVSVPLPAGSDEGYAYSVFTK